MNHFLSTTTLLVLCSFSQADGVYIGKIEGGPTSARIAIVAADERFVCYCCSDDPSFNERFSRWLTGSLKRSGEATAAGDDLFLHASMEEGRYCGELQTSQGDAFEFRISKVSDRSEAGLFRFVQLTDDERLVDGWIVDEEGEIVGRQAKAARKKNEKKNEKKLGGAATGKRIAGNANANGSNSSAKKKQQVLTSKKLGDRLPAAAKKRIADKATGTSKKEAAPKNEASSNKSSGSKKSDSKKANKEGTEEKGAANSEGKKAGEQVDGEKKTAEKKADGVKKPGGPKNVAANKNAGAGQQGDEEPGAGTNKKKADKKLGKNENEAEAKQAGAGNKQKQKQKQKQQGEAAGENEVAADGAQENDQEAAAENVAKNQGQQQKIAKIRNVEQVNEVEQQNNAAVEEAEEVPQPVEVENVKIVNRIKPNNQPNAEQNQGAKAQAALPGEVVEGNLVGVDDEERVLTVDDGQEVVEVPVGNRQMIVVDENGERAAEEPANAAAQGALVGKPGKMLKKLAATGEAKVRIRIGAKNVVVKQQEADAQ